MKKIENSLINKVHLSDIQTKVGVALKVGLK